MLPLSVELALLTVLDKNSYGSFKLSTKTVRMSKNLGMKSFPSMKTTGIRNDVAVGIK